MWLRWCAFAMAGGLCCVIAGLGIGVLSQWGALSCGTAACEEMAAGRQRFAVMLSLGGVIASSLSTAAVAGFLMKDKRPRAGPVPTVTHEAFAAVGPQR